jgi:hypothetical protein
MMDDKSTVNDVVDTTDCLEAIGTFKAMKNLFFIVTFVCLIALQGVFWLNHLGYVDVSGVQAQTQQTAQILQVADVSGPNIPSESEIVRKSDPNDVLTIEEKAQKAVSDLAKDATPLVESEPNATLVIRASKFIPKYQHACAAIRIFNFVLIIAATMYSLILLMSVKVSLLGRLGGISHISKAFFLSLFALVILLPWQGLFEGIVLGAIYTPDELFTKWVLTDESTLICKGFYFARFTGMWVVSFLLLLAAQAKTVKWSKTTLRRLGILR